MGSQPSSPVVTGEKPPKFTTSAVLNLWVATPSGVDWLFARSRLIATDTLFPSLFIFIYRKFGKFGIQKGPLSAYNASKMRLGWGFAPSTPLGELTAVPQTRFITVAK